MSSEQIAILSSEVAMLAQSLTGLRKQINDQCDDAISGLEMAVSKLNDQLSSRIDQLECEVGEALLRIDQLLSEYRPSSHVSLKTTIAKIDQLHTPKSE